MGTDKADNRMLPPALHPAIPPENKMGVVIAAPTEFALPSPPPVHP